MLVYLILGLVFAVAVALFAVANTEPVVINFIFQQLEASLALVILGSATAGALAAGVLSAVRQLGFSYRVWDKEKRSRRLEKEAVEWEQKARQLEGQVETLEEELTETEAYVAHLEEMVRERGGRLKSSPAPTEQSEREELPDARGEKPTK